MNNRNLDIQEKTVLGGVTTWERQWQAERLWNAIVFGTTAQLILTYEFLSEMEVQQQRGQALVGKS